MRTFKNENGIMHGAHPSSEWEGFSLEHANADFSRFLRNSEFGRLTETAQRIAEYCKAVPEFSPIDTQYAVGNYGVALLFAGQYESAEAVFQEMIHEIEISTEPPNGTLSAWLHSGRGQARFRQEKFDDSRRDFERALALLEDPSVQTPVSKKLKEQSLQFLVQTEHALENSAVRDERMGDLEQLYLTEPRDPEGEAKLSKLYRSFGDYSRAALLVRRGLSRLESSSGDVQEQAIRLEQGNLALALGEAEEAIEAFDRVRELALKDPEHSFSVLLEATIGRAKVSLADAQEDAAIEMLFDVVTSDYAAQGLAPRVLIDEAYATLAYLGLEGDQPLQARYFYNRIQRKDWPRNDL